MAKKKANDDAKSAPVEVLQAETSQLTPAGALAGVIARPLATFTKMRDAALGHWWVVFALALLALILVSVATVPIEAEVAQAQMQDQLGDTSGLSEQEQAQVQQMQEIFTSQAVLGALNVVTGTIGLLIGYAVRAGVIFLMGLALGGRASFKQVWRMSVWTTIPDVARMVVAAIAIFATGDLPVLGLSYIFTAAERAEMSRVLLTFLQGIDIYLVWSLVLIGIGVATTSQLDRVKSALIALAYWAVTLVFSLGFVALGQVLGNALGVS